MVERKLYQAEVDIIKHRFHGMWGYVEDKYMIANGQSVPRATIDNIIDLALGDIHDDNI